MSNVARNRLKSSWTPLNNEQANHKVENDPVKSPTDDRSGDKCWRQKIFEERRALVGKWFEKWSDEQRRTLLADLVNQCKVKQLEFTGDMISRKRPLMKDDFTRCLPRVLCLYIYSFLDPRSLCRAAQVCWYWKHLMEVDQIWMPKCIRLGWTLSFTPGPYEVGTWKRLYIENILTLKCMIPKVLPQPKEVRLSDIEKLRIDTSSPTSRPQTGRSINNGNLAPGERAPWRGSDPTPKDTWRNNYLENDDEMVKVQKLRKKGSYGPVADEMMRKARAKVQAGTSKRDLTRELLAKSRSMPAGFDGWSSMTQQRPDWAKPVTQAAPFMKTTREDFSPPDYSLNDAHVRPAPVHKSSPPPRRRSPDRTNRDMPTTDLFPSQGWKVPIRDPDDSD